MLRCSDKINCETGLSARAQVNSAANAGAEGWADDW